MKNKFIILSIVTFTLLTLGCSSREGPQWEKTKKRNSYKMATRQLAPQPVYGGLTWVRPPEITPNRKPEASQADIIMPIINFNVQNKPLKEAILVLAATARYRTYCSKRICDKKITVTTLGTMDEIAQIIENKANIKVIINHQNKEVHFLPNQEIEPVFNDR